MKNKIWTPTLPPFREFKKEKYLHASETSQFIYQLGEGTTIRTKSQEVPVSEITSDVTKVKIQYLKECMIKYREITGVGRGIAAVQVGILERFAVIYMPDSEEKLMTIINPVITKQSEELLRFPEGCMSEGPIYAPVVRPSWIEFEYYDEEGNKKLWNRKSETQQDIVYNRVFQHEIDHMDGIIFLDKADMSQLTLESDPAFYEHATFEKVENKNNF